MNEVLPDCLYSIRGKDCLFLPDAIAPVLPPLGQQVVVLEERPEGMVFCSSEGLREARKTCPEAQIYGYWQMLLASGFVDRDAPLQAVYFGDQSTGQYFMRDSGQRAGATGEIREGRPLDITGREILLSTARQIRPKLQQLCLPARVAQNYEDRLHEKTRRRNRLLLAFYAFLVLAVVTGYWVQAYQEREVEKRELLAREIQDLRTTKEALLKERIVRLPRQEQVLDRFFQVFLHWDMAEVPEQGFHQKQFRARLGKSDRDPGIDARHARSLNYTYEYQPATGAQLQWKIGP